MINFIVVEDIDKYLKTAVKAIEKVMMGTKHEYKIHKFKDYDEKFDELSNKTLGNKVYIFDIETPTNSGIDVARQIRTFDKNSIIIFITAYDDMGSIVIKKRLSALTLVSKFDEFELNLKESILESLTILGSKEIIKIQDFGTVYYLPIKDILYVTRDSVDRKIIIKTSYTEYRLTKSLSEIKKELHGVLTQTHRACLVNEDRIREIDKKNKIIYFNDGSSIDLVSDNYKKELV